MDDFRLIGEGQDKSGNLIKIRWEENVEKPNRGFVCHRATAWSEADACLGFLRVAYIDENEYKRLIPTPWHHFQDFLGMGLGLNLDDRPEEFTGVRAVEFFQTVNQYMNYGARPPEKEKDFFVKIKKNESYRKRMRALQDALDFHMNRPYVDFADVRGRLIHGHKGEDLRGTGVGRLLYYGTAVALEDMGLHFHSSGLQSDEAVRIWDKFVKDGLTSVCPVNDKTRLRLHADRIPENVFKRHDPAIEGPSI